MFTKVSKFDNPDYYQIRFPNRFFYNNHAFYCNNFLIDYPIFHLFFFEHKSFLENCLSRVWTKKFGLIQWQKARWKSK